MIPALKSNKALVIRRGPASAVATLLWDRETDSFEMGQWLKGRIYEHRCDISPDGRHMVIFARRKDASLAWTSVSKAPWLRAIAFWPQGDTSHGGGAFEKDGALWLNGASARDLKMPDGLRPASTNAFPHSTDGFHMGDLYVRSMTLRGWEHQGGEGYNAVLRKTVNADWYIELSFAIGAKNRALISNQYRLVGVHNDARRTQPDWDWADIYGQHIHFASRGCLHRASLGPQGDLDNLSLIRDFSDMSFSTIKAPYDGIYPQDDDT